MEYSLVFEKSGKESKYKLSVEFDDGKIKDRYIDYKLIPYYQVCINVISLLLNKEIHNSTTYCLADKLELFLSEISDLKEFSYYNTNLKNILVEVAYLFVGSYNLETQEASFYDSYTWEKVTGKTSNIFKVEIIHDNDYVDILELFLKNIAKVFMKLREEYIIFIKLTPEIYGDVWLCYGSDEVKNMTITEFSGVMEDGCPDALSTLKSCKFKYDETLYVSEHTLKSIFDRFVLGYSVRFFNNRKG